MRRTYKSRISPSTLLLLIVVGLVLSIIITQHLRERRVAPRERVGELKVLDGDTFIDTSGREIRLLGIDAPEAGEPFSREAESELALLLKGRNLKLEFGSEGKDRYGRTLAFVFADDSIFVNARLLEEGLAWAYFFEENMAESPYAERLCQAQRQALETGRGVWAQGSKETADRYFGNPRTLRFHRPSCGGLERSDTTALIRATTRTFFLRNCYSPCRNCKP